MQKCADDISSSMDSEITKSIMTIYNNKVVLSRLKRLQLLAPLIFHSAVAFDSRSERFLDDAENFPTFNQSVS